MRLSRDKFLLLYKFFKIIIIRLYFNDINIIFQIIMLLFYYRYDVEQFLIMRFIILFYKNEFP